LVGLVSIAFLIPLAGRQAEDSQQITQGLAAGESAIALFNTANIAQPTLESPWCLVDDINLSEHSAGTMRNVYDVAPTLITPPLGVPGNAVQAAINQNRIAGTGFCIDPMFWGFQQPIRSQIPSPFFRTRFPYLFDHTDPVAMIANQQTIPPAPRLLRCSLTSPIGIAPGSWLRQPAAVALSTMYGGDLVQPSTTSNKAIGPLRSVYVSSDAVISTPSSSQQSSWLATITPADSNPPITLDRVVEQITRSGLTQVANVPLDVPRLYDVALVVFSKRDAREINSVTAVPNPPPTVLGIPKGEVLFNVTQISDDALNSGTFNITIEGSSGTETEIQVGNWLMMSRFTFEDILPRIDSERTGRPTRFYKRQIHRWYRIIAVSEGSSGIRVLRISGKPWGWTERELEMMQYYNNANSIYQLQTYPPVVPPRMRNAQGTMYPVFPFDIEQVDPNFQIPPVIQAVILKDVVQVYERQMELR
jgi:hypothetical protein